MDENQLIELRKKYGVPETGYSSETTAIESVNENRMAALDAAWGEPVKKESGLRKAFDKVEEVAKGVGKSVIDTGLGAARIGTKVLETVYPDSLVQENTPDAYRKGTEQYDQANEMLEGQTGLEKAGKVVGDVAQLAVPVGELSKGANVVIKNAPQLSKVATTGVKALIDGVAGGGVTAIQSGDLGKESRDAALISAALPVLGRGATAVKDALKNPEMGGRVINSLIKPLLKDFSYGKNPGKTVAELGITANDFDGLVAGIKSKKEKTGQYLGNIYETYLPKSTSGDISYVTKHLDEAITKAQKAPNTNAALISRLQGAREDLLQDASAGPQELKQLIGDLTKWTGNASDDQAVNKALKQTYGSVRDTIDAQLKPLMSPEEFAKYKKSAEQYGDLMSAENAAIYRDKIESRQNLLSITPKGLATGGALTSIFTSNPIGALVGLGAAGLDAAMSTTAFKTRFASWLAKAGNAEKQQLFKAAPWIKSSIVKSLVGEESSSNDTGSE